MNPATRIGNVILLPGGGIVRLSPFQRVLYALGLKRKVRLDAWRHMGAITFQVWRPGSTR